MGLLHFSREGRMNSTSSWGLGITWKYLQQRKIKIAKEGECPQRAPEGDAAPAAPQPVMAAPNPKYAAG